MNATFKCNSSSLFTENKKIVNFSHGHAGGDAPEPPLGEVTGNLDIMVDDTMPEWDYFVPGLMYTISITEAAPEPEE